MHHTMFAFGPCSVETTGDLKLASSTPGMSLTGFAPLIALAVAIVLGVCYYCVYAVEDVVPPPTTPERKKFLGMFR